MTDHLPNSLEPMLSLRFRLRNKTQDIHRRLDATLNSLGMMSDRDSYFEILKRFLGLYGPLERQIAGINWAGSGIDFNQRRKTQWLQHDLEKLGLPVDQIAQLPCCHAVPTFSSIPEGLGALYVIEGATLGGQVITRHIQTDLQIDAASGGRFFAAYGDRTGSLWREFVAVLDLYGEDSDTAAIIERTAISTFQCFVNWTNGLNSDELEAT